MDQVTKQKIKEITGFHNMKGYVMYFGNSFLYGISRVKAFDHLRKKILRRMEGWQVHLLLRVGKTTLIKLVVQSIPTYYMCTHRPPSSLCSNLDSLVRHF